MGFAPKGGLLCRPAVYAIPLELAGRGTVDYHRRRLGPETGGTGKNRLERRLVFWDGNAAYAPGLRTSFQRTFQNRLGASPPIVLRTRASVRGVRPERRRATTIGARTAPRAWRGLRGGILGVLSSIADSRGHCEYSKCRLTICRCTVQLTVY